MCEEMLRGLANDGHDLGDVDLTVVCALFRAFACEKMAAFKNVPYLLVVSSNCPADGSKTKKGGQCLPCKQRSKCQCCTTMVLLR
jgi:hypothetical protein